MAYGYSWYFVVFVGLTVFFNLCHKTNGQHRYLREETLSVALSEQQRKDKSWFATYFQFSHTFFSKTFLETKIFFQLMTNCTYQSVIFAFFCYYSLELASTSTWNSNKLFLLINVIINETNLFIYFIKIYQLMKIFRTMQI